MELITTMLAAPGEESVSALLDDDSTVFWVDWREDDADIVSYCEGLLQTGSLASEWVNANTPVGVDLYISHKGKRLRVPLVIGPEDRHITLCALNEVLAPDFEVRFCIDSNGNDTLAFLPLPTAKWKELESTYGETVDSHFHKLTKSPNVFTDELPY